MPLDTSFDPATHKFKIVGSRPVRPDGIDKVTGRAKFGADANAPGMLAGKILRSSHAHAKIRSIDTTKAAKLPGVKAIVTRADFKEGAPALRDVLRNVMARDKVVYDGHAVAAVAATSAAIARKALKLTAVDYEILPHVTDVDAARKPGPRLLHRDMITAT